MRVFFTLRARRGQAIFLPLFLGFFTCPVSYGQTNGLVAAYSFNSGSGTTLPDASGGGNNGTITNGVWVSAGKYGGAMRFTGSGSYVTVPHSSALNLTTRVTLTAWVNPSTLPSRSGEIIHKADDLFYIEGTTSTSGRPMGGARSSSAAVETFAPSALPLNTWSHLALTYDGSRLRLYINGTQVSSVARTGNLLTSTRPMYIGGNPSCCGFTGMIDNIRVYNRALAAAEITSEMATPIVDAPPTSSGCDLNGDSVVNSADVSLAVDMTIGAAPCKATLLGAGVCNAALIQRVVNNSLGGSCNPGGVVVPPPPTPRSVELTWVASTSSGVVGYNVLRASVSGGPFTLLTTSRVAGTSYTDTTVVPGNTYFYVVTAVTADNLSSSYSNMATATVPAS